MSTRALSLGVVLAVATIGGTVGCGGSSTSSKSSPTSPSAAVAPSNRSPVISSMEFTPSFGIAQMTTFRYSASATDPDGDQVSYSWDIAGNAASGSTGTLMFSGGGSGTARLTVTDGRGGTASDTRNFVVGCMTGTWRGSWSWFVFTSNLTQNGAFVTGDYNDQLGAGKLDPAAPNTIDVNGNVRLRYKQGPYNDFTLTGVMDQTGTRITGVVNGSGAHNTPFTMTK